MSLPYYLPHELLIFLGSSFILSLIFNLIKNKDSNYSFWRILILTFILILFGVIGTIILANIQNPSLFPTFSTSLYGAFIFIPLFFAIIKLIYKKFKVIEYLNFLSPSILIVIIVMRIRCTLDGCCYGIICDFGIKYGSVTRFPVQLMEALLCFILMIFLLFNERKKIIKVNEYTLLLLGYSILRSVCELFRENTDKRFILSDGQILSIIIFIVSIGLIILEFLLNKKRLLGGYGSDKKYKN